MKEEEGGGGEGGIKNKSIKLEEGKKELKTKIKIKKSNAQ